MKTVDRPGALIALCHNLLSRRLIREGHRSGALGMRSYAHIFRDGELHILFQTSPTRYMGMYATLPVANTFVWYYTSPESLNDSGSNGYLSEELVAIFRRGRCTELTRAIRASLQPIPQGDLVGNQH